MVPVKLFDFIKTHPIISGLFFLGTLLDSVSTSYATLLPSVTELNPLGVALIQPGSHLLTIVLLSAAPLLILVFLTWLWGRGKRTETWKTSIEATAILQITAGINNTLLIFRPRFATITVLLGAALMGSYATRIYQAVRKETERSTRDILEELPSTYLEYIYHHVRK